jgi:formamidopyrimidine-DNA glycosylase
MPELPEVETIRLGLQKKIIGLKIVEIDVLAPKSFIGNPKETYGKNILNIWRKAKILGIELSGNKTILIHLKMSGQLIFIQNKDDRFIGGHPTPDMVGGLPNRSTRVIFTFSDNSKLYFNDQRRFGWVRVIENQELRIMNQGNGLFARLGPEPLSGDFTWELLRTNLLKHKSQPVKVVLLDQTTISGIGNIYASEACFNAGIDPRKRVGNMVDRDFKKLHLGVIRAIKDGIKYGGSTKTHFVDAEGRKGYFLDYAFVYGLDKKACKICKTVIQKIQLRGRGTYFCKTCQK